MVSIEGFYEHQQIYYNKLVSKNQDKYHSIVCIPTGGGKTRLAVVYAINHVLERDMKVLWLTHSQYLLKQAFSTFSQLIDDEDWMNEYGILIYSLSGNKVSDISLKHKLICVSFQSLMRATTDWRSIIGEDTVIIIDEAHHVIAESYRNVINDFSIKKVVLGLTATPIRSNNFESNELYRFFETDLGIRVHISTLFKNKVLVRPIFEDVEFSLDTNEVQTIDELTSSLIGEIQNYNQLIYDQYINNKKKYGKTVIFAINKEHVESLYKLFSSNSQISTKVFKAYSGMKNRDEQFNSFCKSDDGILININIMNEGVDIPDIRTVFMTKPLNSRITVTQIIGRALRKAKGKNNAYIVNFAISNLGRKFLIVTPKLTYRLYEAEWEENDDEINEIEMEEKNLNKIGNLVKEHIEKKASCSFSDICLAGHYTIIDGDNIDIPVPVSFIEYRRIEKYIAAVKAKKHAEFPKKLYFCEKSDCVKEYIDSSAVNNSDCELVFTKYDEALFEQFETVYEYAKSLFERVVKTNMNEKQIRSEITSFYHAMGEYSSEYHDMRSYLSQLGGNTENQFVRLIRNELALIKYEGKR